MIQRFVIDSNMLQTERLRTYLSASPDNSAVLPDFVWIEMYKPQSFAGLVSAFSVIRDFPDQIALLKSGSALAVIDPRRPNLGDWMLDDTVGDDLRRTIEALALAEQGHEEALGLLASRWSSATGQMEDMLEGAGDIAASLPEIAAIFTAAETRRCRTDEYYTPDMFEKIYGAADQIYVTLLGGYAVGRGHLTTTHRYDAYLYRYALAIMIYVLWWIRGGSRPPQRLDRVRNDLIDLGFATSGTYFTGLMTDDAKARWMHDNLWDALNGIGQRLRISLAGLDRSKG
jgi:hypothetical protein